MTAAPPPTDQDGEEDRTADAGRQWIVEEDGSARYEVAPAVLLNFSEIAAAAAEAPPVEGKLIARDRRIESPISDEEADRLRAEALEMAVSEAVQWMTELDPRTPLAQRSGPTAAGVSFDSIDETECCGGGIPAPATVPPDPEMAAGPNHLIAVVNNALEIYNKSGTSLDGPTTLDSFFSGVSGCGSGNFDPNVLYDESTNRFIVGADGAGTAYCVAVSKTADPTGDWWGYRVPTLPDSCTFFDYPHAGVGIDGIYMGSNSFDSGGFCNSRMWALDKAKMYAGMSFTAVSRVLNTTYDTPQPANLHGFSAGTWPSSGPHYFILDKDFNGETYAVYQWTAPWGANTIGEVGDFDLETFTGVTVGFPLDAPQKDGGGTLQANDWRPQDAEYRNGHIWMTNAQSCNPGGGAVNCVRWAEIDPSDASIVQAGVIGSTGNYRSFPDLAVDACNNMAMGYTRVSTTTYASIYTVGREAGDTANTLGSETLTKAGEVNYSSFGNDPSPHRWGDYTGMTIDPDGQTFWYLGEYAKNTGTNNRDWGTWIHSLKVAGCVACVAEEFTNGATINGVVVEEACQIIAGPLTVGATGDLTFDTPILILQNGFSVLDGAEFAVIN